MSIYEPTILDENSLKTILHLIDDGSVYERDPYPGQTITIYEMQGRSINDPPEDYETYDFTDHTAVNNLIQLSAPITDTVAIANKINDINNEITSQVDNRWYILIGHWVIQWIMDGYVFKARTGFPAFRNNVFAVYQNEGSLFEPVVVNILKIFVYNTFVDRKVYLVERNATSFGYRADSRIPIISYDFVVPFERPLTQNINAGNIDIDVDNDDKMDDDLANLDPQLVLFIMQTISNLFDEFCIEVPDPPPTLNPPIGDPENTYPFYDQLIYSLSGVFGPPIPRVGLDGLDTGPIEKDNNAEPRPSTLYQDRVDIVNEYINDGFFRTIDLTDQELVNSLNQSIGLDDSNNESSTWEEIFCAPSNDPFQNAYCFAINIAKQIFDLFISTPETPAPPTPENEVDFFQSKLAEVYQPIIDMIEAIPENDRTLAQEKDLQRKTTYLNGILEGNKIFKVKLTEGLVLTTELRDMFNDLAYMKELVVNTNDVPSSETDINYWAKRIKIITDTLKNANAVNAYKEFYVPHNPLNRTN
jgi:hypothetical protein